MCLKREESYAPEEADPRPRGKGQPAEAFAARCGDFVERSEAPVERTISAREDSPNGALPDPKLLDDARQRLLTC